jgi:UDP-glucose 4-epimerase
MKIVVTGGCGFIGSHIVELLVNEGNSVTVLDNLSTGKSENLEHIQPTRGKLKVEMCDIRQLNSLRGFFQEAQPEAVIHLAAQAAISTSWKAPYLDAHVNVMGTLNVIKIANDYRVKRIVFASTSAVYGPKRWGRLAESDNPMTDSPYGLTKLTAENYLRMLFPSSAILRFGNVYGPRQVPIGENQVIARMIAHFMKGDEFKIHGDGKQTRDYVYVKDVANAAAQAIHGFAGTYNIASGKSLSVLDVAQEMAEIYDAAFYPWEHDRAIDERRSVRMSVRKAARKLMWTAKTPFREGLMETIRWWEAANHD